MEKEFGKRNSVINLTQEPTKEVMKLVSKVRGRSINILNLTPQSSQRRIVPVRIIEPIKPTRPYIPAIEYLEDIAITKKATREELALLMSLCKLLE